MGMSPPSTPKIAPMGPKVPFLRVREEERQLKRLVFCETRSHSVDENVISYILFNKTLLSLCFGSQIEALKRITKADLLNWYMEHRQSNSKRLSIHVSNWACLLMVSPSKVADSLHVSRFKKSLCFASYWLETSAPHFVLTPWRSLVCQYAARKQKS